MFQFASIVETRDGVWYEAYAAYVKLPVKMIK
jgi:hypothetical protein